jgi:hypothetical protein
MNKNKKSKQKKEFLKCREILSTSNIDFQIINQLKGNKDVLNRAFKDTKSELLNG